MAFLEWTQNLEVGNETIDYQHKNLLRLINDLQEAKTEGNSPLLIEVTLDELTKYTKYHFQTEEDLMKDGNFSEIKSHLATHTGFVQKIEKFRHAYYQNKEEVSEELLDFLISWLKDHILKSDKELASFLS